MNSFDLNKLFENHNNNPAIVTEKIVSYKDLIAQIEDTVNNLKKCHVQTGEKIAVFPEIESSTLVIILALIQSGAVVIPINQKLPKMQILQMLSAINCNKLFVSKKTDLNNFDADLEIFQINKFITSTFSCDSPNNLSPLDFNQDATIIFTSGSSGKPKGVLQTIGNHFFNALGSNENIPFSKGDRWLLSLPLYHVSGLSILFRAIVGGGTMVIPDQDISLIGNIKEYDVTHISCVASQLKQLIENQESIEILKNFKTILIGGSSIPAELLEKSIKHKLPIHTTYGSTEMSSQITTTKVNEHRNKLFTSGKVLNHRELKIAEDGEILVKGRTLFKGYVEQNSIINPTNSEGWFHTNDLGYFDQEGYLTVIGRKDNMFISGGENIYPEEIEKCLLNMKGIEEAMVLDIPDEKFGTRPIAFIKTINYELINKTNIEKHLSEFLPKFKLPDAFYKWLDIPNTIKPNRFEIKKYLNTNKISEIV